MRLTFSRRDRHSAAYGITTADHSHLDDVSRRQKQYAATMGFRVVAIIVVVFVPGLTIMERVILGLVATVIPYIAVIRANGAPTQDAPPTNLMIGAPRKNELPKPDRSLTAERGAEDDQGWSAKWVEDDDVMERQDHPE